ncbi:hypothetical protein [Amycolatopsis sp. NBRC 101858]|uniref:hypothetical protein n=1 Tax=Amycolatopsis sp. NBRC 101858 TaxID=3032200 RepID=UPI0025537C1F|nr:hypothetical protein [Amycolatopsis sp. NBRC 101858]
MVLNAGQPAAPPAGMAGVRTVVHGALSVHCGQIYAHREGGEQLEGGLSAASRTPASTANSSGTATCCKSGPRRRHPMR